MEVEVFQNSNIATLLSMVNKPLRFSELVPKRTQERATVILERPGHCVFRIRAEDGEYRWLSITQLYLTNPKESPTMDIIDAAPEIMSYLYLSALRNGVNFRADNFPVLCSCNVVEDSFPFEMLPYWTNNEIVWIKTDSDRHEFLPDPYDRQQMFLLIEAKDCGGAMQTEKILPNPWLCVSILLQVSFAMAVAESALEFEHRDLRLNNLYLEDIQSHYLEYVFSGESHWLRTFGVRVCITGFSASRISHDEVVYFSQLKNSNSSSDDAQEERSDEDNLRRSIYEHCRKNWALFQPYTNIICLQHMFEQMCELLHKYRLEVQEDMPGMRDLSKGDEALMFLCKWRDEIASYKSAANFIQDNIYFCKQKNLVK